MTDHHVLGNSHALFPGNNNIVTGIADIHCDHDDRGYLVLNKRVTHIKQRLGNVSHSRLPSKCEGHLQRNSEGYLAIAKILTFSEHFGFLHYSMLHPMPFY